MYGLEQLTRMQARDVRANQVRGIRIYVEVLRVRSVQYLLMWDAGTCWWAGEFDDLEEVVAKVNEIAEGEGATARMR